MFYKARIKLTLWYLVIIMAISSMFSLVIYKSVENEMVRFERVQRLRFDRPHPEIIEEVKTRVMSTLMIINGAIFIVSGALGYFLAGKTLRPIQEMLDDQIRFVADASHELRTPLTALRSTFEVFLRNKKESLPTARILVTDSLEEVEKLQQLSESLLQLTTNSGHFEKLNLGEIISESIRHVRVKNIDFKSKNIFVTGNKQSLVSLFVILLDNSIKYSDPKTKINVFLENTEDGVVVFVKDQGIGIASKDLTHIFDRFYRADSARTKTQKGGYGLGLAIAKKIIEDHNGSIEVQSELNKGSSFQVKFSK